MSRSFRDAAGAALSGDSASVGDGSMQTWLSPTAESRVERVPVALIAEPDWRDAVDVDDPAYRALKSSIRASGILQPLLLRPRPQGGYEVVSGMRRLRAARDTDQDAVPATVRALSEPEALLGSWEGVQRVPVTAERFRALEARLRGCGLPDADVDALLAGVTVAPSAGRPAPGTPLPVEAPAGAAEPPATTDEIAAASAGTSETAGDSPAIAATAPAAQDLVAVGADAAGDSAATAATAATEATEATEATGATAAVEMAAGIAAGGVVDATSAAVGTVDAGPAVASTPEVAEPGAGSGAAGAVDTSPAAASTPEVAEPGAGEGIAEPEAAVVAPGGPAPTAETTDATAEAADATAEAAEGTAEAADATAEAADATAEAAPARPGRPAWSWSGVETPAPLLAPAPGADGAPDEAASPAPGDTPTDAPAAGASEVGPAPATDRVEEASPPDTPEAPAVGSVAEASAPTGSPPETAGGGDSAALVDGPLLDGIPSVPDATAGMTLPWPGSSAATPSAPGSSAATPSDAPGAEIVETPSAEPQTAEPWPDDLGATPSTPAIGMPEPLAAAPDRPARVVAPPEPARAAAPEPSLEDLPAPGVAAADEVSAAAAWRVARPDRSHWSEPAEARQRRGAAATPATPVPGAGQFEAHPAAGDAAPGSMARAAERTVITIDLDRVREATLTDESRVARGATAETADRGPAAARGHFYTDSRFYATLGTFLGVWAVVFILVSVMLEAKNRLALEISAGVAVVGFLLAILSLAIPRRSR